jgi:ribosomal protein L37AE/L43A
MLIKKGLNLKMKEERKCSKCGKELRCRGASDSNGSISWKCRKCGCTVWERTNPLPPIPITAKPRKR